MTNLLCKKHEIKRVNQICIRDSDNGDSVADFGVQAYYGAGAEVGVRAVSYTHLIIAVFGLSLIWIL